MRFQLMHPALDVNEWEKIHVSTWENMMTEKTLQCHEAMLRNSISSIENNTNLKILNLGNFRINIENVSEINSITTILKKSLEIYNDRT